MARLKHVYLDLKTAQENYLEDVRYPCVRIKEGAITKFAYELIIEGPCKIIYNPDEPLNPGAIFWIETQAPIKTQKPRKLREWLQKNKDKAKQTPITPKSRDEEMRKAYGQHKSSAKQRNIAFELTFAEWKSIWDAYWSGRKKHNYVMARYGDKKGYSFWNVRIVTSKENSYEADNCYWSIRKGVKLTR